MKKGNLEKGEVENGKKDTETGKVEKQKRRPANGPMHKAMKEFIDGKKGEGVAYHAALSMWKTCDERQAIVDALSDAERKRRRF